MTLFLTLLFSVPGTAKGAKIGHASVGALWSLGLVLFLVPPAVVWGSKEVFTRTSRGGICTPRIPWGCLACWGGGALAPLYYLLTACCLPSLVLSLLICKMVMWPCSMEH